MTPRSRNPYCEFKNDIERRKALWARDVRYVLIALVGAHMYGAENIASFFHRFF